MFVGAPVAPAAPWAQPARGNPRRDPDRPRPPALRAGFPIGTNSYGSPPLSRPDPGPTLTIGGFCSIAGRIAAGVETVVRPIGFNHEIALALIPAMAAREVAVSAIATVYAIDAPDDEAAGVQLKDRLSGSWPLPTALAFLAWFVFAPQCISTVAVTRRETNGWKWPMFMLGYLFAVAYVAAGATYWSAVALGL